MKNLYGLPIIFLLLGSLSFLVQGRRVRTDYHANAAQVTNEKSKREIVQEAQLNKLLSKVGVKIDGSSTTNNQDPTYREVKIQWTGATGVQTDLETTSSVSRGEPKPVLSASVLEDKTRLGILPRNRSLELSPTQVLIAAVDKQDQLRWWSIVPDPRIVRAETHPTTSDLRCENYYLSNLTLVVAFPNDPQIVNLRFYHPVWDGTDYDLKLLAVTPIR